MFQFTTGRWSKSFLLVLLTGAVAWGQSSGDGRRTPEGRYYTTDPGGVDQTERRSPEGRELATDGSGDSNFGVEAEAARLRQMRIDLDRERDRITRNQTWLRGRRRELNDRSDSLDRELRSLLNQKAAYRCPNCGRGVDGCFAIGNPPPQTIAFDTYIRSKAQALRRENKALGMADRQWADQARSFADQAVQFNRKLEDYKSQIGAKRSRRSPDEGLFFDDSAKKDVDEK